MKKMKGCEYGLSFTSKAGAYPSGAPYGEVPEFGLFKNFEYF
jgi:hypothetical protein